MTDRAPVGVRLVPGIAELTAHADVKAAAKDPGTFSSDLQGDRDVRTYRQLPLEADPPAHAAWRAILEPAFARPAVAALEPQLRAVAERLVAGFVARGRIEAVHELAVPMVGTSIAFALGRPGDADELVAWGTDAWETQPDGRRDASRMNAYLARVSAEAEDVPGTDVFSRIVGARLDGGRPLTPAERQGLGDLVLAGGRDTVIGLIAGAAWHLAGAPGDRARLAADPSAIPAAVEELLRWLSPLPRIERVVTHDARGGWGEAHAGDVVILGFLAANHDPAAFPDPGALHLDRSPNPHVAFGNGPHTCIGVHLARLEARVLLETLLRVVPDWHLDGDPEIDWEDVRGTPVPARFVRLPLAVGPG
ncbi:MAG: cytochrome P450 [Chloroflexota bacterium]